MSGIITRQKRSNGARGFPVAALVLLVIAGVAFCHQYQEWKHLVPTKETTTTTKDTDQKFFEILQQIASLQTNLTKSISDIEKQGKEVKAAVDGIEEDLQDRVPAKTKTVHPAKTKTAQDLKTSSEQFVSYTPSKWEQMWLDNVDEWTKTKRICEVLLHEQAE